MAGEPTQQSTQNAVSSFLVGRPVTAQLVNLAFTAVIAYVAATAHQQVGGALSGNLPNPSLAPRAVIGGNVAQATLTADLFAPGVLAGGSDGGAVNLVPLRVVSTLTPAAVTFADFYVCLNGPAEADLETGAPVGTTHVIKDCRSSPGGPITVVAGGSDLIDGQPTLTYTRPYQAMTLTYTPLGWKVL